MNGSQYWENVRARVAAMLRAPKDFARAVAIALAAAEWLDWCYSEQYDESELQPADILGFIMEGQGPNGKI